MDPLNIRCSACGNVLVVRRAWSRAYLRCRACGAEYPIDRKIIERMDEAFEAQVANIPCDRL